MSAHKREGRARNRKLRFYLRALFSVCLDLANEQRLGGGRAIAASRSASCQLLAARDKNDTPAIDGSGRRWIVSGARALAKRRAQSSRALRAANAAAAQEAPAIDHTAKRAIDRKSASADI